MIRKSALALCNVALLAAVLALPALAQNSKPDRPVSAHGVRTTPITTMREKRPADACTLFSNIVPSSVTFSAANGYYVNGPNGPNTKFSQVTAFPFTVPAGCTQVNQIQAAIECYSAYARDGGTCGFELAIYNDNMGQPGTAVVTSQPLTAVPQAFTCCVLTVANLESTALTVGAQYWVQADANLPQDATTEDLWMVSIQLPQTAVGGSGGWSLNEGDAQPAVEVLGTP
jgi:hypothetical protein